MGSTLLHSWRCQRFSTDTDAAQVRARRLVRFGVGENERYQVSSQVSCCPRRAHSLLGSSA